MNKCHMARALNVRIQRDLLKICLDFNILRDKSSADFGENMMLIFGYTKNVHPGVRRPAQRVKYKGVRL